MAPMSLLRLVTPVLVFGCLALEAQTFSFSGEPGRWSAKVDHLQAGSQVTIFDGLVPLGTALADTEGVAYLALPSTPGKHNFRAVLRGTGEPITPTVRATIPGLAGSALTAPVVLEPNRAAVLATILSSGTSPGVHSPLPAPPWGSSAH